MINKNKILLLVYCLLFACSLLLSFIKSTAQQNDSLQTMRQFVNICNAYKQEPLYLDLEYTTTTNWITSPVDTGHAQAQFYILSNEAYIKFGEVEQIVVDSIMVLVSEKLQRIMVYKNAAAMLAKMKAMTGMALSDSSIKYLCSQYKVSTTAYPKEIQSIALQSRNLLQATALPRETIELLYNHLTKMLIQVTTTQRSLVPLSQTHYSNFAKQREFAGKLFVIDNGYYVAKEKITKYTYNAINHNASVKIPVRLSDRITRDPSGKYTGAKGYEEYQVTEE